MDILHCDIRQGIRILVKNPLFTLAAALSLGLAIGANGALFGMFNSLLWRPLPVEAPDRLAVAYTRTGDAPFYDAFSWADYRDYAAGTQQFFEGLAAYTVSGFALGGNDVQNAMVYGEAVSGNYFQVVKPHMQLGRGFHPEEGHTVGRDPVVVLADRFWRRQFGADPAIVGRTIKLNNTAFTVVGVAEQDFHGVFAIYFAPDVWVPITMLPRLAEANATMLDDRANRSVRLMGRLRAGQTIGEAATAMKTISRRLATDYPQTNKDLEAYVFPELGTRPEVEIAGGATAVALIFLAFTTLVLLIACANVANLLLSRASARQKEIAMRLALGATRGQLIRQLLTESILLSFVACALGLGVGYVASRVTSTLSVPTDLPFVLDFRTDLRVVFFTAAISVVAGVVFGLIPALQASRTDLVAAIKTTPEPARRRFSLGSALVVVQVAVSLALLVIAGLFLKGIGGARTIDPGFRADRLVFMSLNPGLIGYDSARTANFYRVLRDRVTALPGVESATLAHYVPLDFSVDGGELIIEGRAAAPGAQSVQSLSSIVDTDYFHTLGTRIVEGRAFDERDSATSLPTIIVNQTFARRYWPGQSPIGKRVRFNSEGAPWLTVVGVAADGKYRQLVETPRDYFFVPYSQNPRPTLTLALLARRDLAGTIASVRREIARLDSDMPVFEVKTVDEFMERAYLAPRLSALLIAPAGVLAVVIAVVGLYGVMSYSISRRTREFGIRMAIGHAPGRILALVMRQGLALTAIGVAIGLGLALAAGRVVSWLLFGVSPTDPGVLVGVPLLLIFVAALACYIPAQRVLRIDPLAALRQE